MPGEARSSLLCSFRPRRQVMALTAAALRGPVIEGARDARLYLAVGLVAGAVIALQIGIMRVFAVGSWAHFGSLVVSLAMLGFGLASVVMCISRDWFERHWRAVATTALALFGPLAVAANLIAQQLPFNAIFIVSDPAQKWRLLANFLLYLLPFLAGAFFLGAVFLKSRTAFGRVYFADLTGSGLAGLVVLAAMYLFPPEALITVPLALWAVGGIAWFAAFGSRRGMAALALVGLASIAAYNYLPDLLAVPKIAVSQYKGIAYARNFPDAERIYRSVSPFGDVQIYASSYMHFAPGLSDNAAFNLPDLPPNTYVGMYIDGEGPDGIMRDLPAGQTGYFRYLPMFYPYLLKQAPRTFVVQFGGGISTMVALASGSAAVTVAENNPAVLAAFRDPGLRTFTGDILANPKLRVIGYDGRLYLAHTAERYDIIDLSLADSVGLSNPGGFAIQEKYPYTREAMQSYMRALAEGGILSVTLWNKEEPPKSVLKLYATMADAARTVDPPGVANSLFAVSTYLATTTVLYKRGGFTADEVARLRDHTRAMSFDEVYSPGFSFDPSQTSAILDEYWASIFGNGAAANPAGGSEPTAPAAGAADPTGPGAGDSSVAGDAPPETIPATTMGRLAWHYLISGGWEDLASRYVFDTRVLTNDRPYFAAYVRPGDLPRTLDRLDLFQDEWGYLLLWATLAIAGITAASLVLIPVAFGWRLVFSHYPGKLGAILYFACLGAGYIMVEVGLISRFTLALTNPTVSAAVMIAGMLVFSGLGSLVSEHVVARARALLPVIFLAIAALLFAYGALLDPVLDWIGAFPYAWRLLFSFALIAPPSFLMGFPMATGMTWLARLGKDHMFVWAWGINGCFSVIGAAAVPIVATAFGLAAVLQISAGAYLVAIPAFFAVLLPPRARREVALA
jgi:spermidine synthase